MAVLVGKKAPHFIAKAVINGGEIVDGFSLDQFIGKKYVVLFFTQKISLSFVPQSFMLFKKA
jgi:peroxiredoxin (alkyl hydroperoxide reductase subunit C)